MRVICTSIPVGILSRRARPYYFRAVINKICIICLPIRPYYLHRSCFKLPVNELDSIKVS